MDERKSFSFPRGMAALVEELSVVLNVVPLPLVSEVAPETARLAADNARHRWSNPIVSQTVGLSVCCQFIIRVQC